MIACLGLTAHDNTLIQLTIPQYRPKMVSNVALAICSVVCRFCMFEELLEESLALSSELWKVGSLFHGFMLACSFNQYLLQGFSISLSVYVFSGSVHSLISPFSTVGFPGSLAILVFQSLLGKVQVSERTTH